MELIIVLNIVFSNTVSLFDVKACLTKLLLRRSFQASVQNSGARTISWIARPWRQPRPFDQSWLTLWTGSSFPYLNPPSEPRPTPTTSKGHCWLGSSCRSVEAKRQHAWICLQQCNWIQVLLQIARDVDGSGNYLILTHKHMAHVHPLSSYGAQSHKLGLPEWVVFHDYRLSENNCMTTVSEISPQV